MLIVLLNLGLNIITDKLANIKIIAYSAKKIITNMPDPYSILKPDTNSDSPSEKSKGVRFVSAKHVINQIIIIGINIIKS